MGPMTGRRQRETYRHGDLAAEAATAAYDLVRSGGLKAMTVRAVADQVGVTHRALYNHFADRDALVDAVAERGFLELAAHLRTASSRAAFIRGYLTFAQTQPGLDEAMVSRPHATMRDRPTLQTAVHLGLDEARRLFGDPSQTSEQNRRAVMKVIMLLRGGIAMRSALDLADDEGLITELIAMVDG